MKKNIFFLILSLFICAYCYSQEKLTDYKSDAPTNRNILFEEDGKAFVLNLFIDGHYDVIALNPTEGNSLASEGQIYMDADAFWNAFYFDGKLIYGNGGTIYFYSLQQKSTIEVSCDKNYEFSDPSIRNVDSSSILLPLYEHEHRSRAKYILIHFDGSFEYINFKNYIFNRISDITIYRRENTAYSDLLYNTYNLKTKVSEPLRHNDKDIHSILIREDKYIYAVEYAGIFSLDQHNSRENIVVDSTIRTVANPTVFNVNGDLGVYSREDSSTTFYFVDDQDGRTHEIIEIKRPGTVLFVGKVNEKKIFLSSLGSILIIDKNGMIVKELGANFSGSFRLEMIYGDYIYYQNLAGFVKYDVGNDELTKMFPLDANLSVENYLKVGSHLYVVTARPSNYYYYPLFYSEINSSYMTEVRPKTISDHGYGLWSRISNVGNTGFITSKNAMFVFQDSLVSKLFYSENEIVSSYIKPSLDSSGIYIYVESEFGSTLYKYTTDTTTTEFRINQRLSVKDMYIGQDFIYFDGAISDDVRYDIHNEELSFLDDNYFFFQEHDNYVIYGNRDKVFTSSDSLVFEAKDELIKTIFKFKGRLFVLANTLYEVDSSRELQLISNKNELQDFPRFEGLVSLEDYMVIYLRTASYKIANFKFDGVGLTQISDEVTKSNIQTSQNNIFYYINANDFGLYNAETDDDDGFLKDIGFREFVRFFHHDDQIYTILYSSDNQHKFYIDRYDENGDNKEEVAVINDEFREGKLHFISQDTLAFIQLGRSIYYFYEGKMKRIPQTVSHYFYWSMMEVIDGYLYFIGWDTYSGNQLYRIKIQDLIGGKDVPIIPVDSVSKFAINPNPSNGFLQIKFPDDIGLIELDILNVSGQVLTKYKGLHSNSEIDITAITSGYYVARVRYADKIVSLPFVKI